MTISISRYVWASTLATASRNSKGRLCTGMMVLTSPSTNIGGNPVCARPHLEDQQPPSKIAEDANSAREGIARTVVDEVILHRWPQAQGFSPSALGEDDTFGKTAESRLLVQPTCGHATAKLRACQRLLGQQVETPGDSAQQVFLRASAQEQVLRNPVRDLSHPLVEVRHARFDAHRHTRLVYLHDVVVR